MSGQHDDRNIGQRELVGRAYGAHEFRTVRRRHFPVENDDIRRVCTNGFQPLAAVTGLKNISYPYRLEKRVCDLAHAGFVVDDQHFELSEPSRNLSCSRFHDAPYNRPDGFPSPPIGPQTDKMAVSRIDKILRFRGAATGHELFETHDLSR